MVPKESESEQADPFVRDCHAHHYFKGVDLNKSVDFIIYILFFVIPTDTTQTSEHPRVKLGDVPL